MRAESESIAQPRLARTWRRALVSSGAAAALGIVGLNVVPYGPAGLRLVVAIGLGMVFMGSFWLLADSIRPWLADEAVIGPEERAHADATLRSSYTALFTVAAGVIVYLYLAASRPGMMPDDPRHGTLILWTFVAAVFLLPIGISAWTEPEDGFGGRTVGPLGLTEARFRGASAPVYTVGAVALATMVPLLLAGVARIRGGDAFWLNAVVIFALLVVLAAVLMFVRNVVAEHGARRPGH